MREEVGDGGIWFREDRKGCRKVEKMVGKSFEFDDRIWEKFGRELGSSEIILLIKSYSFLFVLARDEKEGERDAYTNFDFLDFG